MPEQKLKEFFQLWCLDIKKYRSLFHGTQIHSLYCVVYHRMMCESSSAAHGGNLIGGMARVGCFSMDSAKHAIRAEYYAILIELFNDGWFHAVKLDILCPEDKLRKHGNHAKNGQLVALARDIIIDAVHVQIINVNQIPASRNIYYYWDPRPIMKWTLAGHSPESNF